MNICLEECETISTDLCVPLRVAKLQKRGSFPHQRMGEGGKLNVTCRKCSSSLGQGMKDVVAKGMTRLMGDVLAHGMRDGGCCSYGNEEAHGGCISSPG